MGNAFKIVGLVVGLFATKKVLEHIEESKKQESGWVEEEETARRSYEQWLSLTPREREAALGYVERLPANPTIH